jgi:excisionase family DNA binding protein
MGWPTLSQVTPDASYDQPGALKLLSYEEVAIILRCTPRLVRKLVETRKLDSIKVGRLVRIEPQALDRFIGENRREAVPSRPHVGSAHARQGNATR